MVEIPMRLHYFEARVPQDIFDLIALRRCQAEVAIIRFTSPPPGTRR